MNSSIAIDEVQLIDPCSNAGKEWEALVAGNEHSGFMQSLHWARFKQACNQTVLQLTLRKDGTLIGGCLVYTTVDENKPTILAAPYGPLLPWRDNELAAQCLRLLLNRSEEIARRCNAVVWRIEPRITHPLPKILNEFGPAAVNHIPDETLILDISQNQKLLLAGMKHKTRYNIALSQKHGVKVSVVEQSSAESAELLYKMLQQASVRDKFLLEQRSFFRTLMDTLMPAGLLKLLFAEHDGEVLGALALIIHGSKATYLYGGVSNEKRQLMAGYALQWKAIEEAQNTGCQSYDFYGYDQFMSPSNTYSRFSRFKGGFGGCPLRYVGALDFTYIDKLVDNIINFFHDLED